MQANVRKYYLYNFFLNFQLWWPIWIIYLKEDRGLSQAQVTLIDIPFWLSIVLLQIPAAALADRWGRRAGADRLSVRVRCRDIAVWAGFVVSGCCWRRT